MYDLYDLDIKFLFWDGGLGGDALVRAITCRLPLSNNYDTSCCNKVNKHSGSDIFCGVFLCQKISNILATKLNLSTNVINELLIDEKKILLEFCFKLWLVSYGFGEYKDYIVKGQGYEKIKLFKLNVGTELNEITIPLVDHLIKCNLPDNLPKGPYLAKGHHIRYESELKLLFQNYQNIYLMISEEQEHLIKVLYHHKIPKENWKVKFDIYEVKNGRTGSPSYVFDAYKLIIEYDRGYAEKLFRIFNLTLNPIINEFLTKNAHENRKIIKEGENEI